MATHHLLNLTALLGVVMASTACVPPYTNAAAAYAKASGASTLALAAVPSTASDLCRKEARLAYLQKRLRGDNVLLGDFYVTALATPTLHWKEYCAEIDQTSPLFAAGVTALSTYGVALGNLSGSGDPANGIDLSSLSASATTIANSLGGQSISGVIKPVGTAVQTLAQFLLSAFVEGKLSGYVTHADPIVQGLIDNLVKYLDAVQSSLESANDTLLQEVENRADQNISDATVAGGKLDALRVLQFYRIAVVMEDDARHTRDTINTYRSVLIKMKDAHGQLAKADQSRSASDVSKALGDVLNLLSQLQALQSAIVALPR